VPPIYLQICTVAFLFVVAFVRIGWNHTAAASAAHDAKHPRHNEVEKEKPNVLRNNRDVTHVPTSERADGKEKTPGKKRKEKKSHSDVHDYRCATFVTLLGTNVVTL
jgi:hypothetical protein